jgi:hypothetical protein
MFKLAVAALCAAATLSSSAVAGPSRPSERDERSPPQQNAPERRDDFGGRGPAATPSRFAHQMSPDECFVLCTHRLRESYAFCNYSCYGR